MLLWQTFPVSQNERKVLYGKLAPMTDKANEPRDDIRVPCTRIVTRLKKQVCAVRGSAAAVAVVHGIDSGAVGRWC